MMEFLTPFSDYVDNKNFTVRDVIHLGKDILHALESCHEKKIIHRDIKDDNIFVAPDGTYKLGDFGVSKALKDKSRAESVKGTPNFIAPEVYLGKEKYDSTVDVYSLGIVLYKLLNRLRNPFLPAFPAPYSTADEDAAFEARMTGKVPELPIFAQNALGGVVLKAIMPRAERYNSAEEFLEAIEAVERQMSEDELNFVVCEAIMKNEEPKAMNPMNETAGLSSNETIAVSADATVAVSANATVAAFANETVAVSANETVAVSATKEAPAPGNATVAVSAAKAAPAPGNATVAVSADKTIGVSPAPAQKAAVAPERVRPSDTVAVKPSVRAAEAPAKMAQPKPAVERKIPQSAAKPASAPIPAQAPQKKTKAKGFGLRKTVIFSLPFVFLLTYIGFFMILIPAMYGTAISFFDWLFSGAKEIVDTLKDANNILVPIYAIVLIIILDYLLLGALVVSAFFAAKELHTPKARVNTSIKYTGKAPKLMLEGALTAMKNNRAAFERNTVDDLQMIVDSMKYTKDFGISKDAGVTALENDICQLIDALQSAMGSNEENAGAKVKDLVLALKQKNSMRDSMLKR